MKLFVTGGSGYVGKTLIPELIRRGHTVRALARSEASAEIVSSLGATPVTGSLFTLDVLSKESAASDGVINLAFEFGNDLATACAMELDAVNAMCSALEGTNKPFVGTTGVLVLAKPGYFEPTDEDFRPEFDGPLAFRAKNEAAQLAYRDKGVGSMLVRLAAVHSADPLGPLSYWVKSVKTMGFVPIFDQGNSIFNGINKADAATLYALAVEKGTAGSVYNGADEILSIKECADAFAGTMGAEVKSIPKDNAPFMLQLFLGSSSAVTSEKTRKALGWTPTGATCVEDIKLFAKCS